jgi:hypothetical protein
MLSEMGTERLKRFSPSLAKISRCSPGIQAAARLNKIEMVHRWVIVVFIFPVFLWRDLIGSTQLLKPWSYGEGRAIYIHIYTGFAIIAMDVNIIIIQVNEKQIMLERV